MERPEKLTSVATLLGTAILTSTAVLPNTAMALSYDVGDWQIDVDTSLTAAAQWRTEQRDDKLSTDPANINFNDGNNNFDRGSMTSAKGSFILELAGVRENFSFFVRTDGLYDYVYENMKSDMSKENYLTYNAGIPNGGRVERGDYPSGTLDEHGKRMRLLEAFVNYDLEFADQFGAVRLGRQVIAWGEALLYQSVNALQNPIDGGVALSPGVEAKEIFLPTAALDLKWNFTDNLSAEAYYKLEWDKSTVPGVGSYLSPSDVIGPGAQRAILSPGVTARVTSAVDADDYGQWGALLRYVTDEGTTFAMSRTTSHANKPGAEFYLDLANIDQSFTREIYLEDIDVWQFGANTTWGEASVYADLSYSRNVPFVDTSQFVNDQGQLVASSMTRGHYRQIVVGMLDAYTAFPWLAERINLTAEVVYQSNNLGKKNKEDTTYGVTNDAWAYRFNIIPQYYAVLPGLDIDLPMSFQQDVKGYGASVMNSLIEDQMWASIGVHGYYLDHWEFDVKYSFYFGNDDLEEPVLSDRDNVTLFAKYKF